MIPPPSAHTSQGVGDTAHQLLDLFCPPRHDFSARPGWVFNAANALYAGEGRKGWRGPKGTPDYVDEIRHEHDAGSPFVLD